MKIRVCLAVLCFLIFNRWSAYGQIPRKDDWSATWEYKQLTNPSDDILYLYAKDGWDIATAVGVGENSYLQVILKRSRSNPKFGTPTQESPKPEPPPPPKKPTCNLTLAQAPVIRGLKLGMTSDELFAIFPANEREEFDRVQQLKSAELPPNYGYASFQFNLSKYTTSDRFTGISSINISLFDKKVVYIGASYSNVPQFDNPGQLMEIVTRHFGLPEFKDWAGYNEHWQSPSLSCDGFEFTIQAHGFNQGNFSISLTDPAYQKIVEERKRADRAKKREGFKL